MAMAMLDQIPLNEASKPTLIDIMNGSYKACIRLYARHFCGHEDVVAARIEDLTQSTIVMKCWKGIDQQLPESEPGKATKKLVESDISTPYRDAQGAKVTVATAGECRAALVEMARIAAEALGEEIALPANKSLEPPAPTRIPNQRCLNGLIVPSQFDCLNQDEKHPVTNVLGEDSTALQSDADVDHQLLIRIGFQVPVKLSHICIFGCSEDETAPQVVKVFQGKPDIGFQEAEDEEPTQTLQLEPNDVDGGKPIALRFVKFQNVPSLQLFIQENFGGEITRISQLEFYGQPVEALDMKGFGSLDKASEKIRQVGTLRAP